MTCHMVSLGQNENKATPLLIYYSNSLALINPLHPVNMMKSELIEETVPYILKTSGFCKVCFVPNWLIHRFIVGKIGLPNEEVLMWKLAKLIDHGYFVIQFRALFSRTLGCTFASCLNLKPGIITSWTWNSSAQIVFFLSTSFLFMLICITVGPHQGWF